MRSLHDRFWEKVAKGGADECWPWKAQRRNGYGVFSYKGKNQPATRMAYYLSKGMFVTNRFLCHNCDNPACCNPAHLFIGTHSDNMADKARKGRQYRGERHHLSKLTDEKVQLIKALFSRYTNAQIAEKFGVTRQAINSVRRGKSWTHVN